MIELQDVHKTYDTGTKALNGISMKIDDGEFVFLVGPSGSGKSTIIKILTAELRPTSGSALVNGFAVEKLRGRAVPYLRRTLGVIFQDFRLISDKSVYENVAFAMRVIGAPEKEIQKRVPYVLELLDHGAGIVEDEAERAHDDEARHRDADGREGHEAVQEHAAEAFAQ